MEYGFFTLALRVVTSTLATIAKYAIIGIMKQVKITTSLFSELHDLSTVSKLVYVILITKANPIGIVTFNPVEIAALAAVDKYHFSDLKVFGDRVVDLGNNEILLSRYMKEQWKVLSRGCQPHKTVFNLLWQRWGHTRPDGSEPFVDKWHSMGIGDHVPVISGEYQGENAKIPEQILEAREITKSTISKAFIPAKWPAAVKTAVSAYFTFRQDKIMDCRSLSDAKDWKFTPADAKQMLRLVQSWLDGGCLPHAIDGTITNAILGKFKGFITPKGFKTTEIKP